MATTYEENLKEIQLEMQASANKAYKAAQESSGYKLQKLYGLTEEELKQQFTGGKGSAEYKMYEEAFKKKKSAKLEYATA